MKTVTEIKEIYPHDCCDLDALIAKLGKARAETNGNVSVNMTGSAEYGYRLQIIWERPMTEDELNRERELRELSEACMKSRRREEYEKLKAEFENDNKGAAEDTQEG